MKPFIFLLCYLVAGCTTYEYLGSKQPAYAINACSIETEQCPFNYNHEGAKLDGYYVLNSVEGGTYTLSGAARLDLSEKSVVFEKISRLKLTFVFFKGDLVVLEESVTLRGEISKFIKFSLPIQTNIKFESSRWIMFGYRVTE